MRYSVGSGNCADAEHFAVGIGHREMNEGKVFTRIQVSPRIHVDTRQIRSSWVGSVASRQPAEPVIRRCGCRRAAPWRSILAPVVLVNLLQFDICNLLLADGPARAGGGRYIVRHLLENLQTSRAMTRSEARVTVQRRSFQKQFVCSPTRRIADQEAARQEK
jgi:hypothetical protein